MKLRTCIVALIASLTFAGSLSAASAPTLPKNWVNGDPVSLAGLKGKVGVLYFYEEDCPTCRGKWPGILEAAAKYEGKPVVFIAINSGNESKPVEAYAKSVGLKWPVIVDSSRAFEKAAGVGTISTSNIYQMRIIAPDGSLHGGNPGDFASSIDPYLAKATWKVDPAIVPESLKSAWKAVEFGDYLSALPAVRRAAGASNAEMKAAGEAMSKQIDADLDAQLAQAQAAEKAGEKWKAYKLYQDITRSFRGMPKAAEATKSLRTLAADKDIKSDIRAMAMLEQAEGLLNSRNRQQRRQGVGVLDTIIQQYPDTEAGELAKGLKSTVEE